MQCLYLDFLPNDLIYRCLYTILCNYYILTSSLNRSGIAIHRNFLVVSVSAFHSLALWPWFPNHNRLNEPLFFRLRALAWFLRPRR